MSNPHRKTLSRKAAVLARTGLSNSSMYRRIAAGTFPKPVPIGGSKVRWLDLEIDAWIEANIAERDRLRPARSRRRRRASNSGATLHG